MSSNFDSPLERGFCGSTPEPMRRQRNDIVEMFVVYDHPKDFPNHFVLRRWWIDGKLPDGTPTQDYRTADSLEAIRELVPWECVCLRRNEGDDPSIVETWL